MSDKLQPNTQRLWDLVRQMRMELHNADLITNEEYAELASDHPAVARLESYDEMRVQMAGLRAHIRELKAAEMHLRKLLWFNHGCPSAALYGDDGKMDCNACLVDFKNASPERIETIWRRQREPEFAAAWEALMQKGKA